MSDVYPLVSTKQYQTESTLWLEALRRGENTAVIFFPKADRLRRMQQLMSDTETLKKTFTDSICIFQILDFETQNVEDQRDIAEVIAAQLNFSHISTTPLPFDEWISFMKTNNILLFFILPQAEKFLNPDGKNSLSHLSYVIETKAPMIKILSLYETDFTNPVFDKVRPDNNLYQNIFHYPLYSPDDSLAFVQYLEKKWNMNISPKTEHKIVQDCGGHFWLIKQAFRNMSETKKQTYENETLQFRLYETYETFLSSQQSLLEKLVRKQKVTDPIEKNDLKFFKKMRLIDASNRLIVGLYEDFILKRTSVSGQLDIRNNRIELNNVSLERLFSRKEYRIMKYLIENKGRIVKREDIAKCIWPSNTVDQYSDWAIDQIIARVRRRLKDLSLSPDIIKTVRNKGFILEY